MVSQTGGGFVPGVAELGFQAVTSPKVGTFCITPPPGVSSTEPLGLNVTNGFVGFAVQVDDKDCTAGVFEVITANTAGQPVNEAFTIIAP